MAILLVLMNVLNPIIKSSYALVYDIVQIDDIHVSKV